eukprot:g66129.t1
MIASSQYLGKTFSPSLMSCPSAVQRCLFNTVQSLVLAFVGVASDCYLLRSVVFFRLLERVCRGVWLKWCCLRDQRCVRVPIDAFCCLSSIIEISSPSVSGVAYCVEEVSAGSLTGRRARSAQHNTPRPFTRYAFASASLTGVFQVTAESLLLSLAMMENLQAWSASVAFPPPWPAAPAQSLDHDDPPVLPTSRAPRSRISRDTHAVKLCKSLLSLPEQLKQLESGRYSEEKRGSDIFEVLVDREQGSVEVRRLRETPKELEAATREARQRVWDQISKRKQDIAELEKERYDPPEDEWRVVAAPLTCKQSGCAVAALEDVIYAIGGYTGRTCLKSVERFSEKSGRWELAAPMPSKRSGCVAGVINGSIYVAGGTDGKAYLSSLIRYDPATNRWEELAPMGCCRLGAGGAVLGSILYVLG